MVIDDQKFRKLITDAGIAANESRSYAILAVMDEFITSQKDLKQPLEELTEFSSQKGQSFKDKSVNAKANNSASAATASSASTLDARASSSIDAKAAANSKASGAYGSSLDASGRGGSLSASENAKYSGESSSSGSLKGNTAASVKASNADSSSSASSQSASAISAKNVASEEHDNVSYKKLIKYQPQNVAPEKTSQTYTALMEQLQGYDLKVLDNSLFKSKYFKAKPMTIEQMQNGAELAKYVASAKKDVNADFFMVGTSIIIDRGTNASTGDHECTGVATVNTYSTTTSESIASATISESSSGQTLDACAGKLSSKLASVGGPIIGAKVQEFWKNRSTYGQEFVLTLTGSNLSLGIRSLFTKKLKAVPGVEKAVQRSASGNELQIVVTYKGSDPLDQSVGEALAGDATFASLDSQPDGSNILMCMGPCPKPVVAKSAKDKKK
jgi:hypothetical protein